MTHSKRMNIKKLVEYIIERKQPTFNIINLKQFTTLNRKLLVISDSNQYFTPSKIEILNKEIDTKHY